MKPQIKYKFILVAALLVCLAGTAHALDVDQLKSGMRSDLAAGRSEFERLRSGIRGRTAMLEAAHAAERTERCVAARQRANEAIATTTVDELVSEERSRDFRRKLRQYFLFCFDEISSREKEEISGLLDDLRRLQEAMQ